VKAWKYVLDLYAQFALMLDLYSVKLLHAWVLGFLCVVYVAWAAPVALQSLVLVAAKCWIGALSGYFADKSMFPYARPSVDEPFSPWMYRRVGLMAAFIVGMTLGI
jgi:hypothetical protein